MADNRWYIVVSWIASSTPNAQAVQYDVQRSINGGVTWGTIATGVIGLSYTDINVPNGIVLQYRVIAYNSVGSATYAATQWSAPAVTARPTLTNVPLPPDYMNFTFLTSNAMPDAVSVTWTPLPAFDDPGVQIVQRSLDGITWTPVSGSLLPTVSTITDQPPQTYTPSVLVAWTAEPFAVQYEVQRSLDYITWTTLATQTTQTYTDTVGGGLPLNTWVHYRVIGQNSVGDAIYGTASIYVADPAALGFCFTYQYRIDTINSVGTTHGVPASITTLPPVLQLTAVSEETPVEQIMLTWDGSRPTPTSFGLAEGPYVLTRIRLDQFEFVTIQLAADPTNVQASYIDTNIVPGALYSYRIQIGAFTNTPAIAVYAAGPVPQFAPTVMIDPLLPFIDVFWLPWLGAQTYAVERSTDGGTTWVSLAGGAPTPTQTGIYGSFWIDTTPPWANNGAAYRIRGFDALYNNVSASTAISWVVGPPSAPTLTNESGDIKVEWTAGTGSIFHHYVYRSLDNVSWGAPLATVGGSTFSYTDSAVTSFQRYYYLIAAIGFFGSEQRGLSASLVYKAPGDAPGYRIVVNGADVSAIVERGSGLDVDDQIAQKGAVATANLVYEPDPPVILVR